MLLPWTLLALGILIHYRWGKRDLGIGAPQHGSRGRAPVGVWDWQLKSPQKLKINFQNGADCHASAKFSSFFSSTTRVGIPLAGIESHNPILPHPAKEPVDNLILTCLSA